MTGTRVVRQQRYAEVPEDIQRGVIAASIEPGQPKSIRQIAERFGISHPTVLRIWRRHNIDPSTLSTRNELVRLHMDLAARIAKSVASDLPQQMREDLVQVATIGLMDAAKSYDPLAGVSFAAFAQHRIRGACLDSVRRRHWKNATAGELERSDSEARPEPTDSPEQMVVMGDERRVLARSVQNLPGRLAIIVWLHYFEERTIDSIATSFGVNASRVSQLHREALGLMREGVER